MRRSDQSQTAILGALSIMPMTGYALREQIRDTLGHFWSESFGQIYPALTELHRHGLVRRETPDDSRSTVYGITEAGIERLRALLAEPVQTSQPRNGLLLRLFFGAQLEPEVRRQLVMHARTQAENQLVAMASARAELDGDPSLSAHAPYILMTISAGEHSARAAVAWADEVLQELEEMDQSGP